MSDGRAHFTHFMLRTLLRMRQGEGYIRVTAGSLRNDSRLINNTKKKKSHSHPFYCVLPPPPPTHKHTFIPCWMFWLCPGGGRRVL